MPASAEVAAREYPDFPRDTPPSIGWPITAGTVAAALATTLGTFRAATTSHEWVREFHQPAFSEHIAEHIEDRLDTNAAIGAVVSVGLIVVAIVIVRVIPLNRILRVSALAAGIAAG